MPSSAHRRRGPQLRPRPGTLPGHYGGTRGFYEAPEHPQPYEPTEYHLPPAVLRAVEEVAPRRQAPSALAFAWLWRYLLSLTPLPPGVTIYHEGRCGRCGWPLTVPSSVKAGYGPECAGRV